MNPLRRFDNAATSYDAAAKAQAQIARHMVAWAAATNFNPATILDVGSGTGFVAEALYRQWPEAQITALDSSFHMLREAQRKMPKLAVIQADAATLEPVQKFDAIFSSMALHWLPDPRRVLQRWQSWLKPNGRLFVALPTEGSFSAWRDVCGKHGLKDGLWLFPAVDFADGLVARQQQESMLIDYPSALDFLRSLKKTGAATPRQNHQPLNAANMRTLLNAAPRPFRVDYTFALLEAQAARR